MWAAIAALVDVVHALAMASWLLGLPLLFWHGWPRATRAYAMYAIAFIVINEVSSLALGECVLTTLARACWNLAARAGEATPASREWFTVRLSEAIFRLTPSHEVIKAISKALVFLSAIGVLVALRHLRVDRARAGDAHPHGA
jgi:hypothetical protein